MGPLGNVKEGYNGEEGEGSDIFVFLALSPESLYFIVCTLNAKSSARQSRIIAPVGEESKVPGVLDNALRGASGRT